MGSTSESVLAEEFRAAEQTWMDAWCRRDLAACERTLADEFLLVSALGGELFDKVQWLDLARGSFACEWFEFEEVRARGYGAVAAHCLYRQRAMARGRDCGQFRLTDGWMRRDGRWQVVRPPQHPAAAGRLGQSPGRRCLRQPPWKGESWSAA